MNHEPLNDGVLVVDDEFIILRGLCLQLEEMGLSVVSTAATCEEAINNAEKYRPRIVLMDLRLKGNGDGVDAALRIHERVGSKVIFITGSREPEAMQRIQMDHPIAVLFKPVSEGRLRAAIEVALSS